MFTTPEVIFILLLKALIGYLLWPSRTLGTFTTTYHGILGNESIMTANSMMKKLRRANVR